MASLQKRATGHYRTIFCYGGKRFFITLLTKEQREARSRLARARENLHDKGRGRLHLPPGADLPVFLLSDGRLLEKPVVDARLTLREFFDH